MSEILQQSILLLLAALGFVRIVRFFDARLRPVIPSVPGTARPEKRISVIIPARNEEKRIGRLLRSLANQTQPPFETIIVDDESSDDTVSVSRGFGCTVLSTEGTGWVGKSAACYTGANEASGDVLLFLDADVFLDEEALEYIQEHTIAGAAVSIQPYHHIEKPYEQLSMYFNIVSFLGLSLGGFRSPFHANEGFFGPCMWIDRETYLQSKGHLLVKDTIIEDMALGQVWAAQGICLASVPHGKKVFFQMYAEGFSQLLNGWSKNIALGAQKSNGFNIIIIFSFVTSSFSLPIGLAKAISAGSVGRTMYYAGAYLLFGGAVYSAAARLGAFSMTSIVLYPIHASFFFAVFLRSLLTKLLRIPITWRGRKVLIR